MISSLNGDTRLLIATKRCGTIVNMVVKNKDLCMTPDATIHAQKCNAVGGIQYPLVNISNSFTINTFSADDKLTHHGCNAVECG